MRKCKLQISVLISEALDWKIHSNATLRQELVDYAESELNVSDKEGHIYINVEGDSFVCTFIPAITIPE
jgi:hypothetical protein